MTSSLLCVLALTVSAPLPEREAPKGPAPHIMILDVLTDGQPVVQRRVMVYKRVPVVEKVQVGERIVERTKTEIVAEEVTVHVGLNDKETQVFGLDGKRIALENVQKLIKRSTPILVSSDGKPVDPFYLRLAREGTLVVVSPNLVVPQVVTAPPPPKLLPKE